MLNRVLAAIIVASLMLALILTRSKESDVAVVSPVAQVSPVVLDEELYSAYETLLDYEPTAPTAIEVRQNIFARERKSLPSRTVRKSELLPATPPPSVSAPPFSLTGQIVENGSERVTFILSDGVESFTAQIGDTVKGHWRLSAVEGTTLLCEDLAKGGVHRLRMGEPTASNNESATTEVVVRPSAPITYKELLRRRAEIQNAK